MTTALSAPLPELNDWPIAPELWACLSPSERDFAILELGGIKSMAYYEARLKALGFHGLPVVLDAACGIGQWSLAMARTNGEVLGVDINGGRLLVGKAMAEAAALSNCRFAYGQLEAIPATDASIDGAFCYGAFMFSEMPATLKEFHRVLKPGGLVYLNANQVGWYAHLLFDRVIAQRNLRLGQQVSRMAARTLMGRRSQIVLWPERLRRWLDQAGFELVAMGPEGSLGDAPPAYPPTFYGLPALVELLARKRPDGPTA